MITHALLLPALLLPLTGFAQVKSGSDGSDGHDGALNPTANPIIDKAAHPCCPVERQRNTSDYFLLLPRL